MSIEEIIAGILAREGGYVDHPADRGGPTCWGITEAVARAAGYAGEMRALPRALAERIFRRRYWSEPRFDQVAATYGRLAEELADTGVHMGPAVAVKFLQRALNALNGQQRMYADVRVDGAIGPATLGALRAFCVLRGLEGRRVLLRAVNCLQGARYIEIAEADPGQEAFVYGWLRERVTI